MLYFYMDDVARKLIQVHFEKPFEYTILRHKIYGRIVKVSLLFFFFFFLGGGGAGLMQNVWICKCHIS